MTARDRILDAAARVMREQGLVRATTKEIAAEAGYSEAMLYKTFPSKQDIFIAVLHERLPRIESLGDLAGSKTVKGNLELLTLQLLRFYADSFPMSVSIFSSPELLASVRHRTAELGVGPQLPILQVQSYIQAEIGLGRIAADTDAASIAALLCGAAMQQAFLANFKGKDRVPGDKLMAAKLVAALGLSPSSA
jgi:AcrR family transcriptional regulator